MTKPTVEAVLAGVGSYDDLSEGDQVLGRAAWETRDTQLLADLDFTITCPHCGHPYALSSPDCGGHGSRTMRAPDPSGLCRTLPIPTTFHGPTEGVPMTNSDASRTQHETGQSHLYCDTCEWEGYPLPGKICRHTDEQRRQASPDVTVSVRLLHSEEEDLQD
jgi:hypothetical protein